MYGCNYMHYVRMYMYVSITIAMTKFFHWSNDPNSK